MQNETNNTPVAYFCAEFGFDSNVPIYAGGLGVLAGDTVKAAADKGIPFVGVGLLYRGYGMTQKISPEGLQYEENNLFDPVTVGLENVYLDEMPLFIKVHLTELDVWCRVWKKTFANNVVIYFLDTETDQNQPAERSITSTLYSGTPDTLLKQQLILGIGGVKLLAALGIKPSVYHMNEGRPNFLHWELIRQLMNTHEISYTEAKHTAIKKTVYTNHTLVAAGNQSYPMELLAVYSRYYATKMGISVEELLKDGIANQESTHMFSVTQAALTTSRKANGVSAYHTQLSKEIWPEYAWVNITNGVHMPTWQSSELRASYETIKNSSDKSKVWQQHLKEKQLLAEFIKNKTGYSYDSNRFVISWARRMAGYKRFDLLFDDITRLKTLVVNSKQPVQILLSGKAHSGDTLGKQKLQKIIQYMQNELAGHALYIPNYNIEIAQMLTRGSDLWLNTPEMGKEASGTSGMKAISNGVLNLTVQDGWAKEVDWNGKGWVLDDSNLPVDLYEKLENTIVPLFYKRNSEDIPEEWLEMMLASIETSQRFSSQRMLEEYLEKLYEYGNTQI